jgi:hypothetical protein
MSIFATAMPFSIKPELSYEFVASDLRVGSDFWPPEHNEALSWADYNQQLRDLLPKLFLMALKFSEGLRLSK